MTFFIGVARLAAMKSAGSGIHSFILEMNNALRLGLNQPVRLSNLINLYKKLYIYLFYVIKDRLFPVVLITRPIFTQKVVLSYKHN